MPLEADCPHCGRLVPLRAPLALVAGAHAWARVEAKVDAVAARLGMLSTRSDKHRGVARASVRHAACATCSERGRAEGRYGPRVESLITGADTVCPDCHGTFTEYEVSEKL